MHPPARPPARLLAVDLLAQLRVPAQKVLALWLDRSRCWGQVLSAQGALSLEVVASPWVLLAPRQARALVRVRVTASEALPPRQRQWTQQGMLIPIPRPASRGSLHKALREHGSLSACIHTRLRQVCRGEEGDFSAHLFAECRARPLSSKSSCNPAAPSISSAGSEEGPSCFCETTSTIQTRRGHASKQ